jgi:hypothetical protein
MIMKKILYIFLAMSMVIGSCTKVLDVEPTQSISTDQAIKDKKGVENAVIGSYSALQAVGLYGRNQVIVGDLAADNLVWTGTTQDYAQVGNHNIPADNGIVDGMWTAAYDGLNRVNNVLAKLSSISDMSQEERDHFEGELLFIRALLHFRLTNLFGQIPIKTQPTVDLNSIDQPVNPVEQVYTQVITDLQAAESKLPQTAALGRASKFSAKGLLARVYLFNYHLKGDASFATLSIQKASDVINEGGFSLAPAYANLFADNTSESVFEIVYDLQNFNRLAQYFYPRSLTGRYEVAPSPTLIESYEEIDIRLPSSISTDVENKKYATKYNDVAGGTDRVYVLRLAEMHLIRAEALAYTNGDIIAIQGDINAVRNRAQLANTLASEYDDLKLAIENERRHEFAFEGHRWFDLVRTKRATTVLGIEFKDTVFPIPLSEIQTNKNL